MSILHDQSSAYDSPQSGFSDAQPELTNADAVPQTEILRVSCVASARDTTTTDRAVTEIIEQIRADRTLAKLITRIRDKYWHVMDSTNGDRKAAKAAVATWKKALPGVMWSGTFTLRKKDALLQHSGLLCADLDELGREKLGEVSAKLRQSPFLWAVFVSPTADGLKAVFRVRANLANHEASFRAVEQHVFELTGVEIDKKCSDVSRLCFLSHDPDVHLNESARELLPLIETKTKAEQVPVAAVSTNVELRRGITEGLFGDVAWNTPTSGYVTCPGQHLHTSADGERDCEVYLDNVPTLHCFHESCLGIVAGVNHELRSRIANGGNGGEGCGSGGPVEWFNARFPSLSEEYGEAVLIRTKDGSQYVGDISEDFLAATRSEKGTKDSPTVFVPTEQKFYMYTPDDGIYNYQRDADLITSFSKLLLDCARESGGFIDTESLKFRLRSSSKLAGVLKKAQGLLAVPDDFFSTGLTKFIPCANGMLRLSDKTLLPFSPAYRRRNKLAVSFDPEAKCPLFLETLMCSALDPDEVDLLQRWCGLALIGENLAQRFLILSGTAGGGKGTFIRVLVGIIGQANVATLRTQLLTERFELGRFLGKTLLYGADVPENFLNQRGASVLKSLTGYDPVTLEFKRSNEPPLITCRFNAIRHVQFSADRPLGR